MNFGRELRKPREMYRELDNYSFIHDPRDFVEELLHNLSVSFLEASESMEKQSEQQAKYYNLRRRDEEFEEGISVWRSNKALSVAADGVAQGLMPKFVGPFEVERKISAVRYQLKTMNGKPAGVWHIGDLKKVV
ncbi:hypothetical protein B566_EDAN018050 [Ephemera danica]|nr:hypothetical protein B566_EDAN018050 [Ephemera danica]